MAGSLEGKVAIVAGAARGVGRAVARRFAEAGARVMLADEDEEGLGEALELLAGAGDRVDHFSQPIDDRLGVNNLIAATLGRFERIDILVTAARAAVPGGPFELDRENFEAALRRNVAAVFLQNQLVAQRMVRQRDADPDFEGAIVNLSSIAARRTHPRLIAFSVACAALDQLTRSLAAALAPQRIRVNAVALGAVLTSHVLAALRAEAELREQMVEVTPLGRIGTAEEAAEAVFFLASPAASFITGQVLAVDGGRLVLDPLVSPVR